MRIAIIAIMIPAFAGGNPLSECTYLEGSEDYRGTVSKTRSGRNCQAWSSQTPHEHGYTPEEYPESGLEGNNFCRNPWGDSDALWCFTDDPDKRWEYCDVPICETAGQTECGRVWNNTSSNDDNFLGQKFYSGTVSTTKSGKTCRAWNDEEKNDWPLFGLEENYCRNPDGDISAWCYTTDDDWEYCDVPICDEEPPNSPTICFDYTEIFEDNEEFSALGEEGCEWWKIEGKFFDAFHEYMEINDPEWCPGGAKRELLGLTRTTSLTAAREALMGLCNSALGEAINTIGTEDWERLSQGANIDLEEFFEGGGFLNEETGNFQQDREDFFDRGGRERFIYIGNDPRRNDYLPTTEASYKAGRSILDFYENEAQNTILSRPKSRLDDSSCSDTNAIMCCWGRDRQYFDDNGDCHAGHCAAANPADNTDLCWTTTEGGTTYAYPGDETEGDLHCHGFAWASSAGFELNTESKWNNLFYVSLYDHLYQRGYIDSFTDDDLIRGDQAMCGCVEDMNPVARADCTEVAGLANYALGYDRDSQKLRVEVVPGTLDLEFKACEGYEYNATIGPQEYSITEPWESGLESSHNDLSAYVYRLYLEGKLDDSHVASFESTMVGYRHPEVNDGDEEREAVCRSAFEERIGGDYEETELPPTASPTSALTKEPSNCVDGTLAFKGKSKKNCKWIGKKSGAALKKMCNKKSNGKKIYNICQATCARVMDVEC